MIPYPDLVAALERWRMRNGLPVGGGGMPSMTATTAAPMSAPMSAPAPMTAPPRPAPGPAPGASAKQTLYGVPAAPQPVAARVPDRAQTDEPVGLDDADVLDEDLLAPEGGDFAMSFGVSTAKPPADDEEVAEERTAIGNPAEPHTSPFSTEPGVDTFDAEADVFDESSDPGSRR